LNRASTEKPREVDPPAGKLAELIWGAIEFVIPVTVYHYVIRTIADAHSSAVGRAVFGIRVSGTAVCVGYHSGKDLTGHKRIHRLLIFSCLRRFVAGNCSCDAGEHHGKY
jgi:hypothetical protein